MPYKLLSFKIGLTILGLAYGVTSYAQTSLSQADSLVEAYTPTRISASSDSGLVFLDSIIQFYSSKQKPCNKVKALLKKGNIYSYRNEYAIALQHIIRAKKLFSEHNCLPQFEADIGLSLSNLYAFLGDYQKSDSLALLTIKNFKSEWTNKSVLVKLYLYINGQQADRMDVIPYLDTAYQLSRQFNLPEDEQSALLNLGRVYAEIDSIDLSKKYLKLALAVAKRSEGLQDIPTIYNNLAGLENNLQISLPYLDSAIFYSKKNNNLPLLQLSTENKAYILYYDMERCDEAFNHLEEAMALKDTLLNAEKYKAVTEIEQKYENEKKSSQIQALKLKNLNSEVEKLTYKRNQNNLLIGTIVLLCLVSFLTYRFFNIRKNRNLLAEKNQVISEAQQRSDELLLNILPAEIAEELKENGKADARNFDQVSILFTDFKEFTQAAEKLSATELVEEINVCFKAFDQICERYQIEKIKTIGDAYMAAGGLPLPTPLSAKNTVLAALQMQSFIQQRKAEKDQQNKTAFEMRIGIHTGPVVAGIVGVKKFQYDIWGDAVNIASRMENNSHTGKVNISQTTYELLKNDGDFTFENRGKLDVKGKGEMEMYFVEKAT